MFDTSAFGVMPWSGSYKQHNAALKFFRFTQEDEDPEAAQPLVFNNTEHVAVAAIVKGKGMDYDFDRTQMVSWSWWEMVAQMDAESINVVCHGPENRSRGVVGCEFSPRPNSYDHKRHHQLKHAQQHYGNPQLRVWDFVLKRDDGSALRVHPQWSTTKIETYEVEGHAEQVEPPTAGLGNSDGRGTYKYYKDVGTQGLLRFDPNKRPH